MSSTKCARWFRTDSSLHRSAGSSRDSRTECATRRPEVASSPALFQECPKAFFSADSLFRPPMSNLFLEISHIAGLNRLFAHANRARPIILAFHGVTGDPPGSSFYNHQGKHLHRSRFLQLMKHLEKRFSVVPLRKILDWLSVGTALPPRAVALTFDDGYRNNLTEAIPVLTSFNLPATIFIVTDFVFEGTMLWMDRLISAIGLTQKPRVMLEWGEREHILELTTASKKVQADRKIRSHCKTLNREDRNRFLNALIEALEVDPNKLKEAWRNHDPLTPEEVTEISRRGFEIGSHGMTHTIVSRMKPQQMVLELTRSRDLLATQTGEECASFSYPNGSPGDFDERTELAVRESGYDCALTTVKRRLSGKSNRFELPRHILADNSTSLGEFASGVSGLHGFLAALKRKGSE